MLIIFWVMKYHVNIMRYCDYLWKFVSIFFCSIIRDDFDMKRWGRWKRQHRINSTFTISRYSLIDKLTFIRSKPFWRTCVKLTIRIECALMWLNQKNPTIRNPSSVIWPSNQVKYFLIVTILVMKLISGKMLNYFPNCQNWVEYVKRHNGVINVLIVETYRFNTYNGKF